MTIFSIFLLIKIYIKYNQLFLIFLSYAARLTGYKSTSIRDIAKALNNFNSDYFIYWSDENLINFIPQLFIINLIWVYLRKQFKVL